MTGHLAPLSLCCLARCLKNVCKSGQACSKSAKMDTIKRISGGLNQKTKQGLAAPVLGLEVRIYNPCTLKIMIHHYTMVLLHVSCLKCTPETCSQICSICIGLACTTWDCTTQVSSQHGHFGHKKFNAHGLNAHVCERLQQDTSPSCLQTFSVKATRIDAIDSHVHQCGWFLPLQILDRGLACLCNPDFQEVTTHWLSCVRAQATSCRSSL